MPGGLGTIAGRAAGDGDETVNNTAGLILLVALYAPAIGIPVGCCCYSAGVSQTQSAAIEANVAEWTIDAKTGRREFRFKTPEVQE